MILKAISKDLWSPPWKEEQENKQPFVKGRVEICRPRNHVSESVHSSCFKAPRAEMSPPLGSLWGPASAPGSWTAPSNAIGTGLCSPSQHTAIRSGVCAYTPLSLNCELLEQSRAGLDGFRLLQVCGIQRKGSQGVGVGSGLEGGAFVRLCLVSQGHMD